MTVDLPGRMRTHRKGLARVAALLAGGAAAAAMVGPLTGQEPPPGRPPMAAPLVTAAPAAGASPGTRAARQPAATEAAADSVAADTLTLDEVLAEARRANIQLPIARLAVRQALDRLSQARGALWPGLSLEGDLHPGTPRTYESSDARVGLVAQVPLYDGGALRAAVHADRALSRAASADYRSTVKDVELAVRADYAQYRREQREVELQRRGVARLERYLTEVRSRQASGQGVGAGVTRTRSQLAQGRADLDAAEQSRTEIGMELNDLMGRTPEAPLALAPLPAPTEPSSPATATPWTLTPDVQSALASVSAAEAELSGAHAGRLPHLGLSVAGGVQPALVDPHPALMNDGTGWGVEAMLTLSFPLWNRVYGGRVQEARDALSQSRVYAEATRRSVRLQYDRADALLRARYREIQIRHQATGSARDAFVQAESLYRGGTGTALDVLDAYRTWIASARAEANAVLDYRLARARTLRWGTR